MSPRSTSPPRHPRRVSSWTGVAPKGEAAIRRSRASLATAVACLALPALAVTGCGGDGRGEREAGTVKSAVTVDIQDFKYRPERVKVRAGGRVTFVNRDTAPHTAETDPGSDLDTGRLGRGQRKTVELGDAGKISYFCSFHRFMEGTVEVVE